MASKKPRGRPFPKGNEVSKGNTGFPGGALLDQHVQQVFQRMVTERDGLVAIWGWCEAQGWARGHIQTVMRQVRHHLRGITAEKAEDTRARLLTFIEHELAGNCDEYVTGAGEGTGAGTVILKDPDSPQFAEFRRLTRVRNDWMIYKHKCQKAAEKGYQEPTPPSMPWTDEDERTLDIMEERLPRLKRRNHAAIQGYLKLVMRITGIDKLVVEHRQGQRPYRDMSTAELMDELKRLEEAAADQATMVDATVNEGENEDGH